MAQIFHTTRFPIVAILNDPILIARFRPVNLLNPPRGRPLAILAGQARAEAVPH
jgi:hypothetical protein